MSKRTPAEPGRTRAKVCQTRATALRLAIERRYLGITNNLVQHEAKCDSNRAGTVLAKMTREGQLHGARVDGYAKHWFITAEVAQTWLQATKPLLKQAPAVRQPMLKPAGMPAPVTLSKAPRDGEPIVTERTKITRDQRQWPTARWQLLPEAPDERWPSFAASRPGINPDTGKAWETRA